MYTLYGFPKTRSVRVAWALEEIGLPYEYKVVNLKAGEHLNAVFQALNPATKIPVLVSDEGALCESAAIVTFLAEKHAMHEFIPASGTFERGLYEQMMIFAVTELEQPLWSKVKHDFALPKQHRIAQMQQTADWEFERALTAFSHYLDDKEYVCGSLFTMADVVSGQVLLWAKSSDLDLKFDNVKSYAERVLSRPAYEKAWRNEMAHLSSTEQAG
ncbi:glutathione S-transferase family protein [Alteromonas sp. 1_MG-2023]|uniref:glutathione S-transferase family protein n=1 Tax=Alteromonas sp. 1_MG-2023 TaxID=3062669 RepID=UPI0026E3CF43|nr:glutathione S-transferase family protein [Alteromonas sp. 1_MG-2023]MDO6568359.1 glutathione S-transferase family protein [Alteromonas sp. 1_MG-2023]